MMSTSCWLCQHLLSRPYESPPVLCRAYPGGVPLAIISGQVPHDHLLGDEAVPVCFAPLKRKENHDDH